MASPQTPPTFLGSSRDLGSRPRTESSTDYSVIHCNRWIAYADSPDGACLLVVIVTDALYPRIFFVFASFRMCSNESRTVPHKPVVCQGGYALCSECWSTHSSFWTTRGCHVTVPSSQLSTSRTHWWASRFPSTWSSTRRRAFGYCWSARQRACRCAAS